MRDDILSTGEIEEQRQGRIEPWGLCQRFKWLVLPGEVGVCQEKGSGRSKEVWPDHARLCVLRISISSWSLLRWDHWNTNYGDEIISLGSKKETSRTILWFQPWHPQVALVWSPPLWSGRKQVSPVSSVTWGQGHSTLRCLVLESE